MSKLDQVQGTFLCNPIKLKTNIYKIHVSCTVYKGSWRGAVVAVKRLTVIDPVRLAHEFKQEVNMMSRLGNHPGIVMLFGIVLNPPCLLFEYLPYSLLYVSQFEYTKIKMIFNVYKNPNDICLSLFL